MLSAYASSSQLLTSIDGPYIGIFVAIPFTNWLYKKLKGRQGLEAEKTKKVILKELSEEEKDGILLEEPEVVENVWFTRVKVLIISGIMAAVANYIMTSKAGKPVTPDQALPGLAIMAVIILFSYWVQEVLTKHTRINLPAIIYVSLITSVLCVPQLFGETSKFIVAKIMTVGLLPLCTPILAYAGIATGKDMAAFKQQGFKIILVSLLTFMGTFVGSALIAEVVMRLSGAF
ncbi:hypothetical protein DSECCO2_386170 [anaerobic digester metagenome]